MKFPKKILIFDPKEERRNHLQSFLSKKSIPFKEVPSLEKLKDYILDSNPDSIALISLSTSNGQELSLLRSIKNSNSRLPIILLSSLPDISLSLLEQGVVNQVIHPDNWAGILSAIKNEMLKYKLSSQNKSFQRKLNQIKSQQQKSAQEKMDMEEIYEATLENLMTALDLRDVETFGHSRTVAKYSQVLAQIMGIKNQETLDNIRKGALLHDVGKIAIPDAILKKPTSLSSEEWHKIKLHPTLGFGLIKEIKLVKEVGNIILYHHERYDGNGYPKRLKREKIPLEARIFTLADTLDAITSHRPYRKERDFPTARNEIQVNSNIQFDPQIVEAFSSVTLKKWKKIRYESTKFLPFFEEANFL
ncbi:HD domain-containing protein [bacterium]|nr:HD domain-containing protein [bacterium]